MTITFSRIFTHAISSPNLILCSCISIQGNNADFNTKEVVAEELHVMFARNYHVLLNTHSM